MRGRKDREVDSADGRARPGPEGGVRMENRRRRTDDLHRAATALFRERGLAAVSVEDVAAAAGLSKAGFYRYYASLEDLVEALVAPLAEAVDEAGAAAEKGLREAKKRDQLVAVYMRLGLSLTALVASHQETVLVYLQEVRGPAEGLRRPIVALARRLDELVLLLTHAAHAHGLLRSVDPELSAQAVLGLVEHMLHRALREGRLVREAERIPALIAMVLEGLAR